MTLFDLLPPFDVGQRIQAADSNTVLTPGRTWSVTAVTDEGHGWRVDADQGKNSGRAITTRWPKNEPPRIEAAA